MMRKGLDAGQAARSVAQHRAVLRSALSAAMKHSLVARNVAGLADAPHLPELEYEAITPAKARAIFEAVRGDRLEAFVTVALACGLREGEALGARWSDVDLEAGTLYIQRSLHRIGHEWQFLEPKTKRSRRTISLPAPVAQALREHRMRQVAERLLLGPGWEGERWGGLIFTNEVGGPLNRSTVLRHFHRLLARAGLPKMRVHDLRHGAASLMAALGVSARVAMEVLGHSQISTTMNRYTHVAPEWQREAAGMVAKGLWA
jgi:integrase